MVCEQKAPVTINLPKAGILKLAPKCTGKTDSETLKTTQEILFLIFISNRIKSFR